LRAALAFVGPHRGTPGYGATAMQELPGDARPKSQGPRKF